MTSNHIILSLPADSFVAQSTIIQIQNASAATASVRTIRKSGAKSNTGTSGDVVMSAPLAPGNPNCQRGLVEAGSTLHN